MQIIATQVHECGTIIFSRRSEDGTFTMDKLPVILIPLGPYPMRVHVHLYPKVIDELSRARRANA